jgi:hypothetical protein
MPTAKRWIEAKGSRAHRAFFRRGVEPLAEVLSYLKAERIGAIDGEATERD